ncbi:hypothetical protein A6768_07860 [Sphingobium yanoikuyae]|uniref:DUF427 domain-containing protein n=2 Tax=Sphingobium yanoikuyae TaxID=13690 RepID=A0A291MYC1_SPHYA|nr:hypothetical protein A6768_07860 [Sphingobium yanoikuyae]
MQGGKQPGPDHPITLEPTNSKVIVRIGSTIVAESSDALLLRETSHQPVFYIPRSDVMMDCLKRSATRTHCPYKGDASYFSVDGGTKDIAWSYVDPFDHMNAIKAYLAFYPDRVDAIETVPM